MTTGSPMSEQTELQRVLRAIHFPCRKGYLVSRAAYEGASQGLLDRLRDLDDDRFDSPEQLWRALRPSPGRSDRA
ncbi:Protein of unknown function (DUF2795) [Mycolicibacterium chubuense NBB4]|uniref:DUF2795 domain-containing protein n=1 Tax=Mycolicibacterium chubuense (strain NBB4) TaxID=710421 RepID=I4BGT7_MYCCN|nr:DUF2795 domain-containing protein [Mycolicibacterium chubuense]AFM16494.1 Protein of unknown function (DUF2795) [Mycolicibacterium chubuense NBB4]